MMLDCECGWGREGREGRGGEDRKEELSLLQGPGEEGSEEERRRKGRGGEEERRNKAGGKAEGEEDGKIETNNIADLQNITNNTNSACVKVLSLVL